MSLSEENENGLLGTHVTWEDIQKDCFDIWGPSAILGPIKSIREISDGKVCTLQKKLRIQGWLSRIGVVEAAWEDETMVKKNGWPLKFVIKMVTLLQHTAYSKKLAASGSESKLFDEEQFRQIEARFKKLHNVECELYSKFSDFNGKPKNAVLKVYGSHQFTEENPLKGYLLMEFVENVVDMGSETFLEEHLIKQILHALAEHHTAGLKFSKKERRSLTYSFFRETIGRTFVQNYIDTVMGIVANFLGGEEKETVERYKRGSEELKETIEGMDNIGEELGMEPVLCHGDPWTCNILCTEDNGVVNLHALIDYQTTHFGCPGYDLTRVLVNMLNRRDREEKFDFYINEYYKHLSSIWPDSRPFPYTKDQLVAAYNRYLPLQCYFVGVSTAAMADHRINRALDPEETRSILKSKVIELGRSLEECLTIVKD